MRDKIFECFQNFSVGQVVQPSLFLKLFALLTLVEKIVVVELCLTSILFKKYNLRFTFDDAYQEVTYNLSNLFLLIEQHIGFFSQLYSTISTLTNTPLYKKKFNLNLGVPNEALYTIFISKSIHYVDHINTVGGYSGMFLHRTAVMTNLTKVTYVIKCLGVTVDVVTVCLKLIMLLSQFFEYKKITISLQRKFRTEFYLKFNILFVRSYFERLFLQYSLVPFQSTDTFQVGASYLTLAQFIKKCSYQTSTNQIDITALKRLNTKPVIIDVTQLPAIINKITESIIEKYNLNIRSENEVDKARILIDELISLRNVKEGEMNSKRAFNKLTPERRDILRKYSLDQLTSLSEIEADILEDLLQQPPLQTIVNKSEITLNYIFQLNQEIDLINSDLQTLYYTALIYKLKDLSFPVYTSFFYDFRGRIYPNSTIGFAYLKNLRPFYRLSTNQSYNIQEITNSIYFKTLMQTLPSFSSNTHQSTLTNIDIYFLSICFMEIGKLLKKSIYTKNGITAQQFISLGEEIYYNPDLYTIEDTADFTYFLNIKTCLDSFFKTGL